MPIDCFYYVRSGSTVAVKPPQMRPQSTGMSADSITQQVWCVTRRIADNDQHWHMSYAQGEFYCHPGIFWCGNTHQVVGTGSSTYSKQRTVKRLVRRAMAEAVSVEVGRDSAPPDAADLFAPEDHECKICYNYFDLERHTPKLLGCSHTFCRECLDALHSREGRGWRVGCPVCRHRTPVPEYRIDCLPDNSALTEALRLKKPESVSSSNADEQTAVPVPSAASRRSDGSCQRTFRRLAFTSGCVCAIFCFLSTVVLLLLGLVFVHNFSDATWPVGPVCLFVAGVLEMVSLILTWLLCTMKVQPETHQLSLPSANATWPVATELGHMFRIIKMKSALCRCDLTPALKSLVILIKSVTTEIDFDDPVFVHPLHFASVLWVPPVPLPSF